ncbi:hypothetical protein [Allocoleopsis sp.]|uniref:hypothetical protein n=1 Tax=Allocoleopsis sp. TaxID=3088169 RepID=UPI002FCF6E84
MSRLNKLISLAILTLLIIACTKSADWQKTLDSSQTQNPTQRITVLKKIMSVEPPTQIVEAQYVGYQIGDNFLGPADYRFYARIVVEPKNISQWRRQLQPKIPPTEFPASPEISWWLSGQNQEEFEFYSPHELFQQIHGFIAVSLRNEGIIYIYTFTM